MKASVIGAAGSAGLLGGVGEVGHRRRTVAAPRIVATASRVIYDALVGVFTSLGFDAVQDEVFRDLVIARLVEPTSIRDTGRS